MDVDAKKKSSLANQLKMQFELRKITDLNTPDKIENHNSEKFKRQKCGISQQMHNLEEEVSN